MLGSSAPLSTNVDFSWTNSDGTATLYLDTTNTITLVLQNNTNSPLTFSPSSGSSLTLNLDSLLTRTQLAAVSWVAAGWTGTVVDDALQLTPTASFTLGVGQTFSSELQSAVTTVDPTIANVTLTVAQSSTLVQTCNTAVVVLYAPVPNQPPLPLSVSLSSSAVFLPAAGGQTNTLTLTLVCQANTVVPNDTDNPATFLLAFLYGNGAADLTSATQAATIAVNIAQQPTGEPWSVVPDIESGNPMWELLPGTPDVFGTMENAIAAFTLSNIITNSLQGTTYIYLGYSGVPGYSDAMFLLPLQKVPQVEVSLTSSTATVDGTKLPSNVTLTYNVSNATYLTIVNAGYSIANPALNTPVQVSAPVPGTTTFTALASNGGTGQTVSASVTVTATPSAYDALPLGAIIMWSGTTIPEGWAICDGQANAYNVTTPNLVAQFIQGADPTGTNAPVNKSGAADTHTHLYEASFSGTTQPAGGHSHTTQVTRYRTQVSIGNVNDYWPVSTTQNNTPITSSYQSPHTHTFSSGISGTTGVQSSSLMRPAWYALYFIMKCY